MLERGRRKTLLVILFLVNGPFSEDYKMSPWNSRIKFTTFFRVVVIWHLCVFLSVIAVETKLFPALTTKINFHSFPATLRTSLARAHFLVPSQFVSRLSGAFFLYLLLCE